MPAVVRVRRADHNLESGVELPEFYDRFEAIHPGRHSHIDECHGIGLAFIERASYQLDALGALICGLHRETPGPPARSRFAEKPCFRFIQLAFAYIGAEPTFTES